MIIFRKSKPSSLNANLLKVVNRSVPSSASEGKKKKDALADVVEKADGKRKKDKKEAEKDLDKFCKPGEWNDAPTSFSVTSLVKIVHVVYLQEYRMNDCHKGATVLAKNACQSFDCHVLGTN